MATKEALKRAEKKYKEQHYEPITLRMKKGIDGQPGERDIIDEHCQKYGYVSETTSTGVNRSAFIKKAIETQMLIDKGEYKLVKVE